VSSFSHHAVISHHAVLTYLTFNNITFLVMSEDIDNIHPRFIGASISMLLHFKGKKKIVQPPEL
jgi:hypothetical protein